MLKLGEEIKRVRSTLNIEQKEFAKILGISNVHLSNLENGKKIPSEELLTKIFNKIDQLVPEKVLELFKNAKSDNKKGEENISNDIIYNLQEDGLYNYEKLQALLKSEPDNIKYIYGMLSLLKDLDKKEAAREYLLQSLIYIKKEEIKRWIEARYFILEGNFKTAIELMNQAITYFDENNPVLDEEAKKRKAGLLFELANIYYDYGYRLYNYDNEPLKAQECFTKALQCFVEQRNIHKEHYYEMSYANVFWWLAFLGINSKENWELYIDKAENVLLLNHEYIMKNSLPNKYTKNLYSKPYITQIISGMAEAYAQIAIIEKSEKANNKNIIALLKKGEFLLAQHTPIQIAPEKREYYNFYFSYSCFYSIKAEISESLKEDFEKYLDLCYKGLQEAIYSDIKSKGSYFIKDLNMAKDKELKFYFQQRPQDLDYFRKKVLQND